MIFKSIAKLACLVLATAEVQPKANDSPEVSYLAKFVFSVGGYVNFTGMANESVRVNMDIASLPSLAGAPFQYHIHENLAPLGEINCSYTGGHLNPYNGNPNASNVDELEVGDLSGRHGLITKDDIEPGLVTKHTYKTEYVDQYISLNPDSPAFIGNGRSVTFHYANGTRFACSNITNVETGEQITIGSSNSSNSSNSSSSSSSSNTSNTSNSSNGSNGSSDPENLAATNYPKLFTIVGGIAGLSLLI